MTWLLALPAVALSAAVLVLPGLVTGLVLRLRGLALLASAAPLSATAVGLGAVCFDALELGWGLWQLAVSTLVLAGLAWGLRAVAEERWPLLHSEDARIRLPRHNRAVLATALTASAAGIAWVLLRTIPQPDLLAQAHDTIFHAPAVEYIVETGHASSLTIGLLAFDPRASFYPAAWHDTAALPALLLGTPVPVAMNAVNLVIASCVWPLGVLWFTRVVAGPSRLVTAGSAAAAAAMPLFPYLPIQFGVIYPYLYAVALLPAVLGFAVTACGGSRLPTTSFRAGLFLVLAAPGVLLAHPSMLNTAMLLLTPFVLSRAARLSHRWMRRLAPPLWLVSLAVVWGQVRPKRNASSNWELQGKPLSALRDSLTQSQLSYPVNAVLAVLVLLGVAAALSSPRLRWLVGSYCLAVAAFVVGSWGRGGDLRWALTGVWYNDYFRISSLAALLAVPLTGLGIAWAARTAASLGAAALRRRARRGRRPLPPAWPGWCAGAALAVLAVLIVPASPSLQRSVEDGRQKYALTPTSLLVTEDETALLKRLGERVPRGTVIAGDPLTGAGLAEVYAPVDMVQPTNGPAPTEDGRYVMSHLDQAATDPKVCASARTLRLEYVLDFGHASVNGSQLTYRQGFLHLDRAHGFIPVDTQGDARLLRIAACDPDWKSESP
ncbi:DUF6541 family protein [Arthrobacter sp. UM1]|uniref:DUF6541 family protein n=1 Tax=Arthrobacter sp. UM1 TaxID=2766776 RepID=UPI001CF69A04|nr:DUF6541 family protein [Arthrobacter sp. UM1]MCB4209052.1 hypothetical protein [Arthrobacter sp. UM1]